MRQDKKSRLVHTGTGATCRCQPHSAVAKEHGAINRVLGTLDERNRRRFGGRRALPWGRGGVERLREITGRSRNTIRRGRAEIPRTEPQPAGRIRPAGGGQPPVEKKDPVC